MIFTSRALTNHSVAFLVSGINNKISRTVLSSRQSPPSSFNSGRVVVSLHNTTPSKVIEIVTFY